MCTPISLYSDTGRHMVISTKCVHFLSCSMLVHYLSAALYLHTFSEVPVFLIEGLSIACRVSILLEQANIIGIVYLTSHVWFGVRVDSGGWGVGEGWNDTSFAEKILSTCSPKLHQLCRLDYQGSCLFCTSMHHSYHYGSAIKNMLLVIVPQQSHLFVKRTSS